MYNKIQAVFFLRVSNLAFDGVESDSDHPNSTNSDSAKEPILNLPPKRSFSHFLCVHDDNFIEKVVNYFFEYKL